MSYEHFKVQFNWKNNRRQLSIKTLRANGNQPVIAAYEIHRDDIHLFTIYPTFNRNCRKVWKIVEKERESHLPYGFIAVLGNIIEDIYIAN